LVWEGPTGREPRLSSNAYNDDPVGPFNNGLFNRYSTLASLSPPCRGIPRRSL